MKQRERGGARRHRSRRAALCAVWAVGTTPLASTLPVAASVFAPTRVAAQARSGPEAAAELAARAQEYARRGDYAGSLRSLQRAFAADPNPKYVANQGVAYLEMGQYADAVERFEWFLAHSDDHDAQALAESFLMKLRPQVIIISRPPGADVYIDGVERGATPLVTELLAGEHLLELRREGFEPAHRAVVVELARDQNLEVTLEARPEPLRPLPPLGDGRVDLSRSSPIAGDSSALTGWGWTCVGLSIAAGAGTVLARRQALAALDASDEAQSRTAYRGAVADAERWTALYYGGAALAGAALVGGVTMLLVGDSSPAVSVGPGGAAAAFSF